MNAPKRVRCAIYTRKSTEEGLDQDFNSLHAQREACASYIQSQRQEGWHLLPKHYDDGGFSGGTLERPALQQLLADIKAGAVDLIVVYKIDRLTRSLNDFAKLVELMDAHEASFVSVTQSFNTTTSMGRLTLNVLLSFAQFEREVTGERIRDKIGASKKKGMWMGGFEPLGYSAKGRQLVIHPEEARLVRRIFDLYRAHKNVSAVTTILRSDGVVSKRRPDTKGRGRGGVPYSNGAIFNILRNPIYCGKIRHKASTYPGQHEAIIAEADWDEAQAIRNERSVKRVRREQNKNPLLGILVNEEGRRYRATHTTKGHRRYRYYVLEAHSTPKGSRPRVEIRLPADELERHIEARVRTFLRSAGDVLDAVRLPEDTPATRKQLIERALRLANEGSLVDYRPFISNVKSKAEAIAVHPDPRVLRRILCEEDEQTDADFDHAAPPTFSVPAQLRKAGHELRLVFEEDGIARAGRCDEELIQKIARGQKWYEELTSGRMPSIVAIARRERLHHSYVARILYGALLAPDIIERVIHGKHAVSLTPVVLNTPQALNWNEQRQHFGLA